VKIYLEAYFCKVFVVKLCPVNWWKWWVVLRGMVILVAFWALSRWWLCLYSHLILASWLLLLLIVENILRLLCLSQSFHALPETAGVCIVFCLVSISFVCSSLIKTIWMYHQIIGISKRGAVSRGAHNDANIS